MNLFIPLLLAIPFITAYIPYPPLAKLPVKTLLTGRTKTNRNVYKEEWKQR